MTTKERKLFTQVLLLLIALTGLSMYIKDNNEYMAFRDVPVVFIDKYTRESCHKGHCRDRFKGLFRTEDGTVFDRQISAYMYRQMHLGERFSLNIRQFDIRQTPSDNLWWFFIPVLVYVLTGTAWIFSLIGYLVWYLDRPKKQ